jgi:leucyl-tRNA synthetase
MSKSKRNVVDPEIIIESYGADTARLFMLSDSPPERDMEWTEAGVEGASRFLKRIYRMANDNTLPTIGTPQPTDGEGMELVRATHKAIYGMSQDIEGFRLNRAVAQLHTLANAIANTKGETPSIAAARRFAVETLVQLIAPLTPHIAEELWETLGHQTMLADSAWPTAKESLIADNIIEIGVQVNGKLRDTISLARDCTKQEAEGAALASPTIIRYLEDRVPKRVIVVPNRIINVVV